MASDVGARGETETEEGARQSVIVPRGGPDHFESGPTDAETVAAQVQEELYCPFLVEANPFAAAAQRYSVEWALEHGLVADGPALRRLEGANFAGLEAAVFPDASLDVLSLATVWVTLFCALDDYVEESQLGVLGLSGYLARVLAGFRGEAGDASDPIVRGFADLGERLRRLAGARARQEFERELSQLFGGFAWEEIHRQRAAQPDYAGYRLLRESTVGLRPHFVLARAIGPAGQSNDEPLLEEMERVTCLAVGWANDIFTYEKELFAGEVHNLVSVLMRTEHLPLREALERARALHDAEVCSFLRLQARLGAASGVSSGTEYRVAHLRRWIGGHLQWARRNGRYRPRAQAA